jgi:hypothetical protein
MNLKFFINILDMPVHRIGADETGIGDHFIAHAFYQAF